MKSMFPSKPAPGFATRSLEVGLWLSALVCAGVLATATVHARVAQQAADEIEVQARPGIPAPKVKPGTPMARLEIAQIDLSVPVLEDYDPSTLRRGVGHVPGTAVPGGLGNLVLAGHRDTFFRPLQRVKPGMRVQIVTPNGRWQYLVDGTEVVAPEQVSVLDIGERPEMTLITCYPFDFIGSAPRRFIVHAHLLSVDAG